MANNQAVVQFQSGRTHLVDPVSVWDQGEALSAGKVQEALRELKSRIHRNFSRDDAVLKKTDEAIDVLLDQVGRTGRNGGITGLGLGRNVFKREFSCDGNSYRIDIELTGFMR